MVDLLERLQTALADRYAVESEIGRGGMATVYLAEDLKHRRKVAIKVLHPELSVTLAAERFLNEIQIAAGLNHPHILTLHESGEADGLLYYVMPYVPGESLRHRLEREGQLPVEEAVRIAVEVADGLDFAHRQGVIHRDVKPGNILLSDRHAVITDFGIARAITVAQGARVTSTGLGVGTPLYASPEQATGAETLDGRTDVYSLGCVLYEMLSGEVPLAAATPNAVQARRLTETPGPIHPLRDTVPPLLDQVIAKALARLPADRWESAEKFGQALMTATMDATPVARLDLATTPGLEAIATSPAKRKRLRWAIGVAVIAVAIIGAWWLAPLWTSMDGMGQLTTPSAAGAAPVETKLKLEGTFGERLQFASGSYAISPDGDYLAYCSHDDEEDADRLWLADLSAPSRAHRVLASGEGCAWVRWTPSGDRVLYEGVIEGRHNYYAASRVGGSVRPFDECPYQDSAGNVLFDPRKTILSPDGSRRVIFDNPQKFFRVVPTGSCDLTLGDSIPVVGDFFGMWLYGWSPRGDRLLFEAGGTLWTIGIQDKDQTVVATERGAYWPAYWTSPGRFLFFGNWLPSNYEGVMRVAVSSSGEPLGDPKPLPHFDENPVSWFSVSSDARRAVVARQTKLFRIVRVIPDRELGPATVSIVPVTDTIAGYGAFSLSHDGQWVAYARQATHGADLYKVRVSGGTPERLTDSGLVDAAEWSVWSPDDRFVAYSGSWRDTLRLWLVTADGRSSGYVTDVVTNYEMPGLSWEGTDLFSYRADYRGVDVLRGLEIEYGRWSGEEWRPTPQGAPSSTTFVVRAQRELLGDSLSAWSYGTAIGSPDDGRVVASCFSEDAGAYWCLISRRDWSQTLLMASGGGEHPLGWTADGSSLFWQSGRNIYLWPLDGDEKDLLVTLPPGTKWIGGAGAHAVSNCEPRRGVEDLEFVCAVDESFTDLFLVENFDPEQD